MEDNLYKDLEKLKIDHTKNQAFSLPRYWIFPLVICLLIIFFVSIFIKKVFIPKKQPSFLTVYAQPSANSPIYMTSGGYIVAESEITVSSKVAGTIATLNVREGDQVKKGDILATLDNEALRVQMEEAEANLEQAKINLKHKQELYKKDMNEVKRRRELFKEKLISPSQLDKEEKNLVLARLELDKAHSALEVCEKKLNLSKIRFNESTIRAPIDGTVIDRLADPGEMLFPMKTMEGRSGSAIVTLANLNVMNVEVDINEDNIEKIMLGKPALINPDSFPGRTYQGEVIEISPMADRHKNVVPIKVRIKNPDNHLKPDMSAKVTFQEKTGQENIKPVVRIPLSAVVNKNGKTIVLVAENDQIREREVEVGDTEGGYVTIAEGLKDGDRIVIEGYSFKKSTK